MKIVVIGVSGMFGCVVVVELEQGGVYEIICVGCM